MKRSTDPLFAPEPIFPEGGSRHRGNARIWIPADLESIAHRAAQSRNPIPRIEVYTKLPLERLRDLEGIPTVAVLRVGDASPFLADPSTVSASRLGHGLRVVVLGSPHELSEPTINPAVCEVVEASASPETLALKIRYALDTLDRERLAHDAEAEAEYWRQSVDRLNKIGVALSTEQNLAKLLSMIVQQGRELICADAGSLYLVASESVSAIPASLNGSVDLTRRRMRFEVAQNDSVDFPFRSAVLDISKRSIYGYAALTQETVVLEDVYKISSEAEYTWGGRPLDAAMRYRTKSMLAVPMVDRSGHTIGVLQLINRKADPQIRLSDSPRDQDKILSFNLHDIRLSQSLASQASIAIQNALLVESERNRLQGMVAASEQRFQQLIEGSIQGVAIYRGLKPLFANHAYARILGYGSVPEFLASFSFEETFPYFEASRVRALEKEPDRDAGVQRVYEVQATRHDGPAIWLASIARQVVWDGGTAVQVTVNDISSRKAAELKLKASEERFRNLIEGSIQGFVIHRRGQILFANDALARIFGFSAAKDLMAVRGWNDLISPQDRPRVSEHNENRLNGLAAPARYEFQGVHFNSTTLWLEVAERNVEWEGDFAIQGILNDVTERKRSEAVRQDLERQIQHRQKLESLGVLAGGLAHDFNNMLTGILGNAELAALKLPPDDGVRAYMERIVSASQRASHLTRQMLAYAGKGKVRAEPIDINETIRALHELLHAAIPKQVAVVRNLREHLPMIEGDVAQIEQVIMNLITNAAEAIGDAQGQISLSTQEIDLTPVEVAQLRLKRPLAPGRYVSLVVTDNGAGMADDVKARIFEPFFTTKFTGRGLGMSAVLGIVRSHKGAIDVESTPGIGSVFRVYLPVMADLPLGLPSPAVPVGTDPLSEFKEGKVLLIDDESIVRQVLLNMLESLGFSVEATDSGAAGLAVLERHPLDIKLVFLDMTMPGMQPEQTMRRIRQIRPDMPVILCSGYVADPSMQKLGGLRHDAFLQKPFVLSQLIGAIESVQKAVQKKAVD